MQHLKKLKISLLPKLRLIYIALFLALTVITIEIHIFSILLVGYFVYIWKIHHDITFISILVITVYIVIRSTIPIKTVRLDGQIELDVIEVANKEGYSTLMGKVEGVKVKGIYTDVDTIESGYKYICASTIKNVENQTIPGNFDYRKYLASQNIYYYVNLQSCEKISKNSSLAHIRNMVREYILNKTPYSKKYLLTFILADQSEIDQDMKNDISKLGVSHMFAVSGFHVGLFVFMMSFLFSKVGLSENLKDILIGSFLLLYIVLSGYAISVNRAVLMYLFLKISHRYKLYFNSLDILSLLFIINLLVYPFAYYNMGFLLSYFITFILLISHKILQNKTIFNQMFLVSCIAFLFSMPIVLYIYHQINLLTILYNIVLSVVLSFVVLPLVYITFLFPFFDALLAKLIYIYEYLINVFSEVDFLIIKGSINSPIIIFLLYMMIFILFTKMETHKNYIKELFVIIMLVFVGINQNKLYITKSINFIDVYGDATLITDAFDRCNILIDTGEGDDYNKLINYLVSKHVSRIDYLIISHFHSDHYGELNDIVNFFDVVNLVSNRDYYLNEKSVKCGSIYMEFILPNGKYNSENNNSLMTLIKFNNKHILFTGDAEIDLEDEFVSRFNIKVDLLKVAHHGSITSSSEIFLDAIKPKEVFIIVNRNNRNNHPSEEVIKRFENMKIMIYRTDLLGTIETFYLGKFEWKIYHKP